MAAGFLGSLFGDTPTVPKLPTVSLPQQQQAAVAANTAALPGAESMVSQANKFSQDQITQMLKTTIPNLGDITSLIGSNIKSGLAGEIPPDVAAAIQRSDAAGALGGGFAGGGAMFDLKARDIATTSYAIQQESLSSAESWIAEADQVYSPGEISVSSMFISPEQEYQATNQQNMQQFQRQWLQNQVNAMPNPQVSGAGGPNLISSIRGGGGGGSAGSPGEGGYGNVPSMQAEQL